ncbi:MAG: hypothetical protein C0498_03360 [Anaerolinea sp.]|nr:hypothetical protein [Anaerolinea sp.]
MTASEFAFLALGLVLGVASGSAIVVVLGGRPPGEVRLTVRHDAVPRRAATLSSDAFTAPGEPARGGPADRRHLNRDAPGADPPPPSPYGAPGKPGVPVMRPVTAFSMPAGGPAPGIRIRTPVPSWPSVAAASAAPATSETGDRAAPGAIPIPPERDPSLDALRIQAVLAAERAQQAGLLTATALPEARSAPEPASGETAGPGRIPDAPAIDATPALVRILRGDRHALLRTVKALAGADDALRRPWRAAMAGLADALIRRAIERGLLDFPVGNPFWDTFTTAQCRSIAEALAALGFRFDGIDGWADERIPSYRDLTAAVAVAGLEPRRIRAWPTQEEIAALYREVTVAADELVAGQVVQLELTEVQELVGAQTLDLELLWRQWEVARAVLAAPIGSS